MSAVGLQPENNGKRPGGVTGRGWRPGQSGNPSGKRRGCVSLVAALKRNLSRADAKEIALRLIGMAKAGDLGAAKLLFERLDSADFEARLTALEVALKKQQ
jgi:hypothetical protein